MARGGPGQRRRLAELSERSSYRLNGVQRGSIITMCHDRYGRWELGYRTGMILKQSRDTVWIQWEDREHPEPWAQGDARYEVDRGRARISGPRQQSIFSLMGSGAPNAVSLTSPNADASIDISLNQERKTEGRKQDMAEQSATLSAKQVATKLGTDAKTFRRFLRSNACTVEPVGQGGRYEFGSKDIEALKTQFVKWRAGKAEKPVISLTQDVIDLQKPKKPKPAPKAETVEEDDEPTDEDLEELEGLEDLGLDLDDLE